MSRNSVIFVVLALCLLPAASADTVVFEHQGQQGPVTQGWTQVPGPGAEGNVVVGPIASDAPDGSPTWIIQDNSTASGSRWFYEGTPTPGEMTQALADGWTLRARIRVVNAPDALDYSVGVEVATGDRRFALFLSADSAGNPSALLWDGSGTSGSSVALTGSGYHVYEMVYDPTTQTVDLYLDDTTTPAISGYAGFTFALPPRVIWGSNHSAGTGWGNYNLVRWSIANDCGNGQLEAGEECDDGGADSGDGCAADCTFETGWSCTGVPALCEEICGDGIIVGDEECEDGNTDPGDGCGPTCQLEQTGSVVDESSIPSTVLSELEFGSGSLFAEAVTAIGDLDGDGVDDLAVHDGDSFLEDGTAYWHRGAVYILFMNADGTVRENKKITDGHGGFTGQILPGHFFGKAMDCLGDLDGDGVVDLVVGAYNDETDGTDIGVAHGAVWILFLQSDGTVKAQQKIDTNDGGLVGLGFDTNFGVAVATIGDLDGDDIPEVAVGAHLDNEGGFGAGAVWILYLNRDGTVRDQRKIFFDRVQGPIGDSTGWRNFGRSLARIGDLDRDGVPDLAVGLPFSNQTGQGNGEVWILFLNADGTVRTVQTIHADNSPVGPFDNLDFFGWSIARLGDLDADGVVDLGVGVTRSSDPNPGIGHLWILFMNPDGTVRDSRKIGQGSGGFVGPLPDFSEFGSSIAALGDSDGNGSMELVVGARGGGFSTWLGELWILEIVGALAVCGDGVLDPLEECDDDNVAGADGCSAACQVEQAVALHGLAEGGRVSVTVDGVTVMVATVPGQTFDTVLAALEAALEADPFLSSTTVEIGVFGNSLVVTGVIATWDVDDPGFATCGTTDTPFIEDDMVTFGCPIDGLIVGGGNFDAYQWYYEGVPIAGATAATYDASLTGEYRVNVADTQGCRNASAGYTSMVSFCADSEVSPDGAVHPLRIDKDATSSTGYRLRFQSIDGAEGYNVYVGTLGSWYSHGSDPANACDVATELLPLGELGAELPFDAADRYYLVSAFAGADEGPSGLDSSGAVIDPAQSTCLP